MRRLADLASLKASPGNCPSCGAALRGFIEGRCQGARCEACDYNVVTTYWSPLERDETIYALALDPGDCNDLAQIREVARVAATSFVRAKGLLRQGGVEIARGRARELAPDVEGLRRAGVPFHISPDYPH